MKNAAPQMNKVEVGSVSMDQSRQRKTKLLLLLVGLVFSAAVFLTLDWFRSAAIRRTAESSSSRSNQGAYRPFIGSCGLHDPVRHHVLKPNCASLGRWGGDTYEVLTNSLGFRDERIREVPLADLHPRILMLGDSMTEGIIAWRDSYVGRVAAHFPQYDFLNGGVPSYSPSNYLNTARIVLAKGVDIDEVIVFIDISDVQDEAFWYRDVDASGAVTGPDQLAGPPSWYQTWRSRVSKYFMLTNYLYGFCERFLVVHGYPHLIVGRVTGDPFDMDRGAWTYRRVDETSYAPLGVEGGIAKREGEDDPAVAGVGKAQYPDQRRCLPLASTGTSRYRRIQAGAYLARLV